MAETDEQVVQNQEEGTDQSGHFFRPKWQSMVIMVLLFVAFFLCFMFLMGWKFAVVLLVSLSLHEAGHLWAMWRCGMKLKGLYFLPGLGVAAVPASNFDSRGDEAFIAIMGPVWGLAAGVAAYVLHMVTGLPEFASAAWLCVLINLFNMIPVAPLDGGRVIRSALHGLSAQASVWVCSLFYMLSIIVIYQYNWVFALLIIFFGTQELMHHRLKVHLEDDFRRVKAAVQAGGAKFGQLLTDAETLILANGEHGDPEVQAALERLEPTDENMKLMDQAANARGNRLSLWPFGFMPVTPDDIFVSPMLLRLYLSEFKISPALTVGKGLMYIGLFLGLAAFLVILGMFCHEALPIAQWLQPLLG